MLTEEERGIINLQTNLRISKSDHGEESNEYKEILECLRTILKEYFSVRCIMEKEPLDKLTGDNVVYLIDYLFDRDSRHLMSYILDIEIGGTI